MKSTPSKFIHILIIVGVIATAGYFLGFKNDHVDAAETAGLVSANKGATQGLPNTTAAGDNTGSQVVSILRNLSVIKLDDAVFRNPALALLTDISISLPPVTNQGRRNPFAPVGTDNPAVDTTSSATTTTTTTTTVTPTPTQ